MSQIFDFLQLFGGILLTVGYIPQIRKILRTKNVESFDLMGFSIIALGIGCMEAYACYQWFVRGVAGAFMITNTIAFIIALILVGLILYYRKGKR
jgi:MtN3 and saliva related transmembrane protein